MSRQSPDPLDLNNFLPYRLSVVTNKISQAFANLYSGKFDLSVPEWRIMAVLGQQSGLSADQVCMKTEMDKVTVSRAVTKLLNKKMLNRKFSKADKRRSILNLSNAGYAIYSQIVPIALDFEKHLLSSLTGKEKQLLEDLLNKLDTSSDRPA